MRRRGTFLISCYPHDNNGLSLLRAAQEGCAVTRCEYRADLDAYEVHADHPEFDPIDRGFRSPSYSVVFDDADGEGPKRVRFAKQP